MRGPVIPSHENVAGFLGDRSALTGARWLPVRVLSATSPFAATRSPASSELR